MKLFLNGFVAFLLCPLLLTSCNDSASNTEIGGLAPENISGKSMTIRDLEGDLCWNIQFRSNTSATFDNGWADKCSCTSIKYQKTGAYSATLQIKGIKLDYGDYTTDEGDKDFSLIFTSQNEGTVKGSLYKGSGFFSLF